MQSQEERSQAYKNQAYKLLKKEFANLSVAAISATFGAKHHDFFDAYYCLKNIQAAAEDAENDEEALQRLQEQYDFLERVAQLRLKTPRVVPRFTVSNTVLRAELEGIPEFNEKENQPPALSDDEEVGGKPRSVPNVTCGCCFGDFPYNAMVECSNGGHSFCCDCVQQYVQEQLFNKNCTTFQCIDSSGDQECPGVFHRGALEKLPAKLLESVDARIALVEIKKAGYAVITCPKCEFCGVVEDANISVVSCTECSYVFYHLCQEPPHKGKSCEDAKAAKEATAVNTAAEAMTAAVVRHCPRCKLQCFKEEGCNSMTCPNSDCVSSSGTGRTLFCYLCRQEITSHEHFCQAPHCDHKSCNKCILFTKTMEGDRHARRQAGLQHLEMAGNDGEAVARLLSPEQAAKDNNLQATLLAHIDSEDDSADEDAESDERWQYIERDSEDDSAAEDAENDERWEYQERDSEDDSAAEDAESDEEDTYDLSDYEIIWDG